MPIGTNWCPKVTQRIPALKCAEQAFATASMITSELGVQRTGRGQWLGDTKTLRPLMRLIHEQGF